MSHNQKWYDPTSSIKMRPDSPETQRCECGCTYFEEVHAYQFPKLHNVILGQRVKPINEPSCYIFRCIRCFRLREPQIQLGPQDRTRKTYEKFLNEVNKPLDVPEVDKGLKVDKI
jgi:hypothetical protein